MGTLRACALAALGLVSLAAPLAAVTTVTIDSAVLHQTIRGFGASSAWASTFSTAQLDALFRPDTGIGLTLLRHRIPPDSNFASGASILQGARDRGATIWATCWSPPGNWKNTGSANSTGTDTCNSGNLAYLLPANYQNYANYLASYVTTLKNNYNVDIWAISPQNEPNWCPNYEGSWLDGNDFLNFVKNFMGPTFQAQSLSTRIIIPEPINTGALASLANPCLGDAGCRGYLFGVATHLYGTAPSAFPAAASNGKEYWETEISSFEAYDAGMTHGLTTADWIHGSMASDMNAFHYWWAISDNNNEGLLTQTLGTPKRYYVMGNYSKFIRPGYQRIGAPAAPVAGVNLTAYKGLTTCVIVAVNHNASASDVTFNLSGFTAANFTPWITDGTRSLASQAAVSSAGGSFTYSLPAKSVVSFVAAIGSPGSPTRTPTYAGTSTHTPTATPTPQSQLFDDFEDVNTADNWGGSWASYAGAASSLTLTVAAGGAPGSTLGSASVVGTIGDYGGLTGTFSGSPRDLTPYVGISFMVRGSGTYWWQVATAAVTDGDHYGATFNASGTWTQVTIYFSNLSQRGWGAVVPLNLTGSQYFQWASYANGAYNLQIDDVKLLTYSLPTATRSPSASATRTNSPSPTRTASITLTGTPTGTRTSTPTATATPAANTATFTPSSTPSSTRTATPSASPTASSSATRTTSPSASVTSTPLANTSTFTPSASPSSTHTATPTPLAFTATWTPTASPTSSSSATRTATPSASPSSTASPSKTWTPIFVFSQTNSPTLSASPSATRTATPSSTPTNSATSSPTRSASPTVSSTFTISPIASATASPTQSPVLSATDSPTPVPPTATPSSTAVLPSATPSPLVPSATETALVPTATVSPVLPTATPSPVPPTATSSSTAVPPSSTLSSTVLVPSATASATAVIPPATGTQSSTPTLTPLGATASPSATLSATRTATLSVTRSATPSLTSSPANSSTLSATPSATPLATATLTPTRTAPAAAPTLVPDGPLVIRSALPWPNPNPSAIVVDLEGPADRVILKVYTAAWVAVGQSELSPAAQGWVRVALPADLAEAPRGLYYFTVQAQQGGRRSPQKAGRFYLWR